jgi:hypothetical protein
MEPLKETIIAKENEDETNYTLPTQTHTQPKTQNNQQTKLFKKPRDLIPDMFLYLFK